MDIFKTYIIPFLVFIFIFALAKYGVREYFRYDRLSNTGITVEMCNEIVNNISFPLKVDEITLTRTAVCMSEGYNKPASLIYIRDIDTTSDIWIEHINNDPNRTRSLLKSNKKVIINSFCTEKDQRALLDGLTSVGYRYNSIDGSFIGDIYISKQDCKTSD
jgi:hypothetical protein